MIYPLFGYFSQQITATATAPTESINTSSLYTFTTITFTNAGSTGSRGPTYAQMLAEYSGSNPWITSSLYFTSSIQGIQLWTVPATATYRFTAAGAQGGNNTTTPLSGGLGALVTTDITLNQNSQLAIVVGQRGLDRSTASSLNGGAGGGGTFVYDNNTITYYLAVGGGGGAAGTTANLFTNQATASGKFNTTSGTSTRMANAFTASGGVNGNGGNRSNRNILYGGPGAGINSSGSRAANNGQGLSRLGNWLGGLTGSTANTNAREGGFGGGGGAVDGDLTGDGNTIAFAGGGGGYSGGGSGGNGGAGDSQYGGGGGSYYTGSLVTGSNGTNVNHGYVTVTKL